MKITPENITALFQNEVFVFGSNTAGRHGKGAAKHAMIHFGAKYGIGMGRTGQCYAIATKDDMMKPFPPQAIGIQVREFMRYVREHPDLEFFVTQLGCGLAGYSPSDIAPLFFREEIPANVSLPQSFWDWRKHNGTHAT